MTARRMIGVALLTLALGPRPAHADSMNSISWRWSAWAPATDGSTGYAIPAALLGLQGAATPTAPMSWAVPPRTSSTPAPARSSTIDASLITPPPTSNITPQTLASVAPTPGKSITPVAPPVVSAPAVTSAPAVSAPSFPYKAPAAAPAPTSSINPTGISWNYSSSLASVASAAAAANTGSAPAYDAVINMGSGPFASSSSVTTGGAMPWYLSPTVEKLYGGVPSPDQQLQFTQAVLARVQSTYQNSGLNLRLTTDTSATATHSLSVVSGTQSPLDSTAVGMTAIGSNGFTFIDKLNYASSIDELEWAVAHNVAHELTHAFGVDGHDASGRYLDSAVTPWSMLVDANSLISPTTIQEIAARSLGGSLASGALGAGHIDELGAAPVPEPATYLTWTAAALLVGAWVRKHRAARKPCIA